MGNEPKTYTSGAFAKKAGVSQKTIHHYDKEGLLSPSSYSEAGYRLYTDKDFEQLQQILTLKYIGFSLHEIKQMRKQDSIKKDVSKSLLLQRQIIDEKINHLKLVKRAINEAEHKLDDNHELDWNWFINIISMIDLERIWMGQYKNSANLSTRIKLHDKFSTNTKGWFSWFFNLLSLKGGENILELGCGNASLWLRNVEKIPEDCKITLTDITPGMLIDARKNLGIFKDRFTIDQAEAESIPFRDNTFDIVIADHMLYLVSDRRRALSEISRVMKPGGRLYISTIGRKHLEELKLLLNEFKNGLTLSNIDFSSRFGLENGSEQLKEFFEEVRITRYADGLLVDEGDALVDYVASTSGNAGQMLVGTIKLEFQKFIEEKIKTDGKIKISKDTGVFTARKLQNKIEERGDNK